MRNTLLVPFCFSLVLLHLTCHVYFPYILASSSPLSLSVPAFAVLSPLPPWMTRSGMPWFHLHSPNGPPSVLQFSLGLGSAPGGSNQETCVGVSVGSSPPWRACCVCPSQEAQKVPLRTAQLPAWVSGPHGASWCSARRCPSLPWWPCCACGSGSPCPSSTWATTSASASSHMTTLCALTRFPGRSLNSGGT